MPSFQLIDIGVCSFGPISNSWSFQTDVVLALIFQFLSYLPTQIRLRLTKPSLHRQAAVPDVVATQLELGPHGLTALPHGLAAR